MPTLAIVNRSQAPYYKALYSCLGEQLGAAGWKVVLLTLDKHWEGFRGHRFNRELVIPEGIKVEEIRARQVKGLGELPPRQISRELEAIAPSVILVHETSLFNFGAFAFARNQRIPLLLSTEVGRSNLEKFSFRVRYVRKWMAPLVRGVVVHSPAASESDLDVPRDRVARAYHAYDAAEVHPRSTEDVGETIRLVFLGQVIPRKGLDHLLDTMADAKREGIAVILDVIGRGEDEWLEGLIEERGLESEVHRHGFLEGERIGEVLRKSEVFVLPSRFDTYGAVTQEAACYGLALWISRNAGSHCLVEDGVNGCVFEPDNREGRLESLKRFRDPSVRKKMMLAGRATAEEFGACKTAESVAALVQSV